MPARPKKYMVRELPQIDNQQELAAEARFLAAYKTAGREGALARAAIRAIVPSGNCADVLRYVLMWFQSNKQTGKPKTTLERLGLRWIAKSARAMANDLGMSEHQAARALERLNQTGLKLLYAETRRWNGHGMTHVRPNYAAIEMRLCASGISIAAALSLESHLRDPNQPQSKVAQRETKDRAGANQGFAVARTPASQERESLDRAGANLDQSSITTSITAVGTTEVTLSPHPADATPPPASQRDSSSGSFPASVSQPDFSKLMETEILERQPPQAERSHGQNVNSDAEFQPDSDEEIRRRLLDRAGVGSDRSIVGSNEHQLAPGFGGVVGSRHAGRLDSEAATPQDPLEDSERARLTAVFFDVSDSTRGDSKSERWVAKEVRQLLRDGFVADDVRASYDYYRPRTWTQYKPTPATLTKYAKRKEEIARLEAEGEKLSQPRSRRKWAGEHRENETIIPVG